jgi:fluoride exporter
MLQAVAICAGASLGACARWQLGLWFSQPGHSLPWGTLTANWLGAYAIGVCLAIFQQLPHLDPAWRLALITGLLGGLTTFSTFSAEAIAFLQQHRYVLAISHVTLHVLGSLFLTVLGLQTVAWLWPATTA